MDELHNPSLERVFRCLEVYREGREGSLLTFQTFLITALRAPISPADMQPLLRSNTQSISTALARLAASNQRKARVGQLGLIRMDPHPDDRRFKFVSLTPSGSDLISRMSKVLSVEDRQG